MFKETLKSSPNYFPFALFLLLIEKVYFQSCIVSKFFQINILFYQFENEGIYINPILLLNPKVQFEINSIIIKQGTLFLAHN